MSERAIVINCVGDFCVRRLDNHQIGGGLSQLLRDADLNIVNLESPIKSEDDNAIKKSGPCHYQDNNVPRFLEDCGFNVIAMANNHIMDYGVGALQLTRNAFSKALLVGAGSYNEIYKINILAVNGKRIGILSLTQYEFGVLVDDNNNGNEMGTAWMGHPKVDELLLNSRQECDFLIVIPHAGLENFDFPLPEIRTLYRHFISMGADAVIGGHPHVPQCWELFNNKPIVYSLGNFCFDVHRDSELWNKGLMACLKIHKDFVTLVVEPLYYDRLRQCVDILNDADFSHHLSLINKSFNNETKYRLSIDTKCRELESYYTSLFEYSGYYRPQAIKFIKLAIRQIMNRIMCRGVLYDDTHFINNIRCETHRWIISRIYELNNET